MGEANYFFPNLSPRSALCENILLSLLFMYNYSHFAPAAQMLQQTASILLKESYTVYKRYRTDLMENLVFVM